MSIRILHTSDWHLGRNLYGQNRYAEFDALLDWMIDTLTAQRIDILLIAGDIFDTSTPSNRAMRQYYDFLRRVAATPCQHVVIIGGNHDSPTFLNAPRDLLRALNIHVTGAKTENPAEEIITLKNHDNNVAAIICAVPYLRDRDIRLAEAGESIDDKEQKLLSGIREHYRQIYQHALALHENLPVEQQITVPVIGMGHLFTAGAQTIDGDGVRELYVGSLAHVSAGIFPDGLDYVALGHLHVPQAVGDQAHIRYSGSPLPMGFGEAQQQKSVCIIEFKGRTPDIRLLPIPVFQQLRQIRGDLTDLQHQLEALVAAGVSTWVEVIVESDAPIPGLREKLESCTQGSEVLVLRIKNTRTSISLLEQDNPEQTLDDLSPLDVFQRCLQNSAVPQQDQAELLNSYQEILRELQEMDIRAE